jgi:hypothetical protein
LLVMVAVLQYDRLPMGGFQVGCHGMLSRVVWLWDIGVSLFTGARLCLIKQKWLEPQKPVWFYNSLLLALYLKVG